MPSTLLKKPDVSSASTRTFARHYGNTLDDAKAEIEYGLGKCDILKISDNEVEFLFGTTDYDKGAALLEREIQHSAYPYHNLEKTEAALTTKT